MKVLFLDVDGVLIHERWRDGGGRALPGHSDWARTFDPECAARLDRIVVEADAWICVSSSWRVLAYDRLTKMRDQLSEAGLRRVALRRVIGMTPYRGRAEDLRGDEVNDWLHGEGRRFAFHAGHPDGVTSYVILDDAGPEQFLPHQHARLVQTTWADGLTEERADAAVERFRTRA